MYLNTSTALEKYLYIYLSDTSQAPEKPGKYLYTSFRGRRSVYIHLSGAGEVIICTADRDLLGRLVQGQVGIAGQDC